MQDKILQNSCAEVAISKAAEKLFGGRVTYNSENAKNDEQCDLSTLFTQLEAHDLIIANQDLGGKSQELGTAYQEALRESGGQRVDEDILAAKQAPIMNPIRDILLQELQLLNPRSVYMLRTGIEGGAGHFHIVYFNQETNTWILSSGSHTVEDPENILINVRGKLGNAARHLLYGGSNWGRGLGERSLCFYEMTVNRTLLAAKYVEKYRDLTPEQAGMVFPQSLIDEVLAESGFLSSFGSGSYWSTSENFNLPEASREDLIAFAEAQCLSRDNAGAIEQLNNLDFFKDERKRVDFFKLLLQRNLVDSVRKILDDDIVGVDDLTANPLDFYADAKSFNLPLYENRVLHILQNRMLTLEDVELPFTINDVCESLNASALALMYAAPDAKLVRDRLIQLVKGELIKSKARRTTIQEYNEIFKNNYDCSAFALDCLNVFVTAVLCSVLLPLTWLLLEFTNWSPRKDNLQNRGNSWRFFGEELAIKIDSDTDMVLQCN